MGTPIGKYAMEDYATKEVKEAEVTEVNSDVVTKEDVIEEATTTATEQN